MAVTKKEFTELLGESISADLAAEAPPADSGEQVFSEAFEKRMSDFFSGKRSGKAKLRPKRWLIAAIAAVLLLAAVACAVPEIRRSIAGFFVKIFGDHVEYTDPDITKDHIEEEYGLVPIPEGYTVEDIQRSEDLVVTYYSNTDGYSIYLNQSSSKNRNEKVDNEHGESYELEIDGRKVVVYSGEGGMHAAWLENGYYFSLVTNELLELTVFEKMISSVKPK